ncbi:molybdenum ABC transporter ATP-binding protein [Methylomonas koyamae]|uniref:molybdenum ABC transporter ATP-binding protein n=1 Tax=Methylomonas koyamae TaxID=702114 RepID=UPI0011279AC4|nr:ATP-binding cassette domain-containing protein [Methylomonas koyamae]TPQ24659.1 molybdenum ABC transporter ATP-binding protein [Methylomonas koyamae]
MSLDVNVRLRRGHFELATQMSIDDASVGLLGKSGAGKSTLLNLIAGTLQPQSGYISLNGKILYDSKKGILMPREQRPIGAVLQTDCADSTETVRDTLQATYFRTLKQRRLFKLDYLIDLLELGGILDNPLQLLSGGERQRVALARSLFKSPKLLLLDETFATIGKAYRMQLLPILKRLLDEFGLTVLYASQSVAEIIELTDQLVVLEHGQVMRSGSLRDIAKQHGALRYLGIRQIDNILPITVRHHDFQGGSSLADSAGATLVLPLRPNLEVGSQTQISIRANDIALSRAYIDGISIQNQLKGRICALIPNGESLIVQIDCGGTLLAEITPGACATMALREGDVVYCLIKTHAIVYLAELDHLPYQRVISHGDGYFYMSPAAIEPLTFPAS